MRPGTRLGAYEILAPLGKGGMGEVYVAADTRLGRRVALKVLPPDLAADRERLDRFRREARALASLDHPHIVHLYTVEEAEGVHFLTMQLVPGSSLAERIPPGGMGMDEFLAIAIPLVDALRAAHEKGIIHRDLKPANVMVDDDGRVRILDFGLAKLRAPDPEHDASRLPTEAMTREGVLLGTVPYMSPEQARGEPLDHRSDIFSLGILLHEMLVGVRPFPGDNPATIISAILRDTPPPVGEIRAGLPDGIGRIIDLCLQKDPGDRYGSAAEIHRDLVSFGSVPGTTHATPYARSPGAGRSRSRGFRSVVRVAFVLVFAVALVLLATGRFPFPAGRDARVSSLAVLPLSNLTGDPGQEYFVDGMTDALINDLSKVKALRVLSRTTAMRYKNADKPLLQIARELGVDAIVEGSVLRDSGQVRISAQLIDAATDTPIWADDFDRNLTGVFALQSDIAQAIAAAIEVTLSPEEERRLSAVRETTPASYQAYLRGMYWLNHGTPEGIEKGMAFLHEAVDQDPGDALAYAGLALGYITVAHGPAPPVDSLSQARSAAHKAVRLDDSLAEAHAALAFLQGYYDWDWELARQTLDHALDINPSLAIAHYHASWLHVLFGRMDEAIEAHKRAQRLDPLMPLHTAWLGEIYRMEGRFEEAIAEAERAIEIAPGFPVGHFVLAKVYEDQGRYEDAIEAAHKAAAVAPPWRWALGTSYAAAGRLAEAHEIVAEIMRQEPTPWNAIWLAQIHAALGNRDAAFRWLNYDRPHAWVPWVRVLTWFESLRNDPRFHELLRRMNLPPTGDGGAVAAVGFD